MKQVLIENISKNKELPKTMSEVYRSLGLKNYRFECEDSYINNYTKICMIAKSLNGPDWNPKIDENVALFYPYFEWDIFNQKFKLDNCYIQKEIYTTSFNLAFKSGELAKYAGKIFEVEYNKWLKTSEKENKIIEEIDYRYINKMSDVYRINGIKKLKTLPNTKERYYEDLILITRAFNGNLKPDYFGDFQNKFFNYFENKFKFSFIFSSDFYSSKLSNVSSDICFKNREIAEYAAKKFNKQYEKFIKFN